MLPRLALIIGAVLLLGACDRAGLAVDDAAIRPLIPGRDTTAGYFTITNNTSVTVTLTGARADQARAIEIHESLVRDDRVRMRRVEQVVVPAGETVQFAPGGLHLMIFGVASISPPFEIELLFADAPGVIATFTERQP